MRAKGRRVHELEFKGKEHTKLEYKINHELAMKKKRTITISYCFGFNF